MLLQGHRVFAIERRQTVGLLGYTVQAAYATACTVGSNYYGFHPSGRESNQFATLSYSG